MNYRLYFYVPWKEAKNEAPKEFLSKQKKCKKIKMYLCNFCFDSNGNYDVGATSLFAFADIFPESLALFLQKECIKTKLYLEKIIYD